MVSQEYAVGRIRELRDWADYILASLSEDQDWERGNVEMIGHLVGGRETLEQIRRQTKQLSESLSAAIQQTA